MSRLVLTLACASLASLASLAACKRGDPPLPAQIGTAEAPRRVDVKVSNMGYTPERVPGRPGERLSLSFQYDKSAGECGREVLLPEGAEPRKLTLEEGKAAQASLTLPQKGELTFTCGMNMLRGTLVVQ